MAEEEQITYREAIERAWLAEAERPRFLRRRKQRLAMRAGATQGSFVVDTFNQMQAEGEIPKDATLDDTIAERDWEGFFRGLAAFVEILAPIFMKIFGI